MRITYDQLENLVKIINRLTISPQDPYSLGIDGKYHPNAGCYHLSGAYGGTGLMRMCEQGTGVTDVFNCGHVPKRELYNRMRAFILGLEN